MRVGALAPGGRPGGGDPRGAHRIARLRHLQRIADAGLPVAFARGRFRQVEIDPVGIGDRGQAVADPVRGGAARDAVDERGARAKALRHVQVAEDHRGAARGARADVEELQRIADHARSHYVLDGHVSLEVRVRILQRVAPRAHHDARHVLLRCGNPFAQLLDLAFGGKNAARFGFDAA